jgi:hypothetical protein
MTFKGLFIGIDRYASAEINWLSCASRDATALHALFSDSLGGETTLLTDGQATVTGIRERFERLAASGPDDVVVIAFSGHGAEEVGHLESERRMFWVRLRLKALGKMIFVATAHLTTARRYEEAETGASPRVGQLKRIADALTRVPHQGEPAFFMGDMNDPWHPQRILKQAGLLSCFAALGMQSPPTFQCYPTANIQPGEQTVTEAIDLIAANNYARAIAACVPQCYAGDIAPSDHWPVQAVYQLV